METLVLKNKEILPTPKVLENALKESYPTYVEFSNQLTELGMVQEWNYYNDGKAWLCKLLLKKKNLGWLYIYDGYFNISCFFMEKHTTAISELDIDEQIKTAFIQAKPAGKLMPLTVRIKTIGQLPDALKIIGFKKGLK